MKATVYTKLNEYQEAINYWNKFLRVEPHDNNAICCRGILFTKTKRERLGVEEIRKAMVFEDEVSEECKKEARKILAQYEHLSPE